MWRVSICRKNQQIRNRSSAAIGLWQLTLRFVRDVDASDMHSAFKEGFENALGQKAATLKPQIDAMNAQIV
jgi:hypothetical protein